MQASTQNTDPRPAPSEGAIVQLAVSYRSPFSVTPDPGNARTHSRKQIRQLMGSIKAHGFVNPIIIDEHGVIIAGHGRLLAAKELSLADVPTITISHLSAAGKKALRLADNKIALNAGWDIDQLRIELAEIQMLETDFDLSLTGFASGEIDVLLNDGGEAQDDELPTLPVKARVRMGDIWACGDHRIGCGDARDLVFVQKVVGEGVLIDAAFMDPPYNVKISGHAVAKGSHREFAMASGEMTTDEFRKFLRECLRTAALVSRSGAVHFVCMDWAHALDLGLVGQEIYDCQLNLIVWNKSNAGMGSLYRSKHELIFVFRVAGAPHFNAVELGKHGRNRTNVWDYASVNTFVGSRRDDLELHPTVKPIAMVAEAIKDVTKRGELVLDTFLGSGTTLLATERAGRKFRGVEYDAAYADLAISRWEAMTGKEAVLIERVAENPAADASDSSAVILTATLADLNGDRHD